MFVMDTDIYSLFARGQEHVVRQAAQKGASNKIGITIITKMEVLRGRIEFLLKSSDSQQIIRAQRLFLMDEQQLAKTLVLLLNDSALDLLSDIRRIKGIKKIGRNDLLIACITLGHRATLVTRNEKDYRLIPGLSIENWAD
jgi:tRNA(fMet)-specific endonuclease VapC